MILKVFFFLKLFYKFFSYMIGKYEYKLYQKNKYLPQIEILWSTTLLQILIAWSISPSLFLLRTFTHLSLLPLSLSLSQGLWLNFCIILSLLFISFFCYSCWSPSDSVFFLYFKISFCRIFCFISLSYIYLFLCSQY